MPANTCTPMTRPGVGESCDGIVSFCKTGLYCDHQSTHKCLPLGKLGESCSAQGNDGCVQPLVCVGTPSTCQAPGRAGASCANETPGCDASLKCSQKGQCEPITWVDPGQPCDGALSWCRRGYCPQNGFGGAAMSICPPIIADGVSCGATDTCESSSLCFNMSADAGVATGTCNPASAFECR
jgi:hypothetical protein